MIDGHPTRPSCDGAIQALELVAAQAHVVAQDVKHFHHLTEDKDAMAILFHLGEELIKQHHFSAACNEALDLILSPRATSQNTLLRAGEHVGMIADFLEFHHDIEK